MKAFDGVTISSHVGLKLPKTFEVLGLALHGIEESFATVAVDKASDILVPTFNRRLERAKNVTMHNITARERARYFSFAGRRMYELAKGADLARVHSRLHAERFFSGRSRMTKAIVQNVRRHVSFTLQVCSRPNNTHCHRRTVGQVLTHSGVMADIT